MKVSRSIAAFLESKRADHNGKDLLDFFLANPGLETQVNVRSVNDRGEGRPVEGKRSTFTDGLNDWWAIRIPKKADSEPEWNDYELRWSLEIFADAIGSTGWDWQAKRSLYVGFDFDAIAGHAKGVGIDDAKLDEVRQAALALPWVQVRRSTGGAGLHLYVFFGGEGVPTDNHTEHAALGRCILGLMSAETGFNFAAQIDACGGNMWLWHRKSTPENRGLELVKPGELFPLDKVPVNWKDHVAVVTRRAAKVKVGGITDDKLDMFEQLTSAHRIVALEDAHKEHIDAMVQMGFCAVWDSDRHMLQAHTMGFKRVSERFKIEGPFETSSGGNNPQSPNCFAFPADFGAWKIYRFSPGIHEHATWEQDGQGWTTCWFNRPPDLKTAARATGGVELKRGGFEYATLERAKEVAALLGQQIEFDSKLSGRKAVVHATKDGRLTFEVAKTADDGPVLEGWNSSDKKNFWTMVCPIATEPRGNDMDANHDDRVRALRTPTNEKAGWAVKEDNGQWTHWGAGEVKQVLQSYGYDKPTAEEIMGLSVRKAWTIVCLPFDDEYPGDRRWNMRAPQYRFPPASRSDELSHPHWDMVFNHIGRDLDDVIKDLPWAQTVNIRTGGDYLRAWFAAIFKDPMCRLPYLFLFGDENCGKSILWEAFELLVTSGVVKADRALTNQSDFNGELAGAILCVVEEKDISKSPGASAKIKDAVTGLTLSIRKMRTDSYQIPNLTHWIQTANHQDACVVPPGDTRIVVIYVNPIEKEIAKPVLMEKLKEEGPAFLCTLRDLELPHAQGRLSLPVVATRHKARSEEFSRSALDSFIREQAHRVIGEMVPFKEFYEQFIEWLPPEDRHTWTRTKVSRSLPVDHPSGAYTGNQKFIGNMSWDAKEAAADAKPWVINNGKLVKRNG